MDRERLSAADQLTMIFGCGFTGATDHPQGTIDISWQPSNNTVSSTLYMYMSPCTEYALHIILPGSLYRVSAGMPIQTGFP